MRLKLQKHITSINSLTHLSIHLTFWKHVVHWVFCCQSGISTICVPLLTFYTTAEKTRSAKFKCSRSTMSLVLEAIDWEISILRSDFFNAGHHDFNWSSFQPPADSSAYQHCLTRSRSCLMIGNIALPHVGIPSGPPWLVPFFDKITSPSKNKFAGFL